MGLPPLVPKTSASASSATFAPSAGKTGRACQDIPEHCSKGPCPRVRGPASTLGPELPCFNSPPKSAMKLLMFLLATLLGTLGWYLGEPLGGLPGALVVSTVGSILGVYLAWRIGR
jgi:hypothetical protein